CPLRIRQNVMHVDRSSLDDGASGCRVTARANGLVFQLPYAFGRRIVVRHKMAFAVLRELEDYSPVRLAQSRGRRGDGIDHGLEVRCRSANDAEYLTGRRLPLQGFGEVICALTQLVEQPCVLNGD